MALLYLPRSLLVSRSGIDPCEAHGGARVLSHLLDPTVFIDPRALVGTDMIDGLYIPEDVLKEAERTGCNTRSVATAFGSLMHGLACVAEAANILEGSGYCVHLTVPSKSREWSGNGARETFHVEPPSICCDVKQYRRARDWLHPELRYIDVLEGAWTSGTWTEMWPLKEVATILPQLVAFLPQRAVRIWAPAAGQNTGSYKEARHIEIRRERPAPERGRNHREKDDVTAEFLRRADSEVKAELTRTESEVAEISAWTMGLDITYTPFRAARAPAAVAESEHLIDRGTGTQGHTSTVPMLPTASIVSTSLFPSGSPSLPIRGDTLKSQVNMLSIPPSWLRLRRIYQVWEHPVELRAMLGGGRWNAGYQFRLSGSERAAIRIEGEPVAELDFGAFQPRLALHLAGIDPGSADLYLAGAERLADKLLEAAEGDRFSESPDRADLSDFLRSVVKKSTMRFLFSPVRKDAVSLKASDINELIAEVTVWPTTEVDRDGRTRVRLSHRSKPDDRESNLARWLRPYVNDPMIKTLSLILADEFDGLTSVPIPAGLPLWAHLQLIESEIICRILNECRTRNLPIITVHDAVVCRQRDEGDLRRLMLQYYQTTAGVKFAPVIKVSYGS